METFHILHLAACWRAETKDTTTVPAPPLDRDATAPSIYPAHLPSTQVDIPDVATSSAGHTPLKPPPRIRAAAAQMVFASRTSQDFITPEEVASVEAWTGRAVLEALVGLEIEPDVRFSGVQRLCLRALTSLSAPPRRERKCLGDQGGRAGADGAQVNVRRMAVFPRSVDAAIDVD